MMKRGLNIALDKPVLSIYAATPEGASLLCFSELIDAVVQR